MGSFTFATNASDDDILTWELARRRSTMSPEELLGLEIRNLLLEWGRARKQESVQRLLDDPASLSPKDKTILGLNVP